MSQWQDIATAPKGATPEEPWKEHWILGTNGIDCKVIRWCMEYPYNEGAWVYAETTHELADIPSFLVYNPNHWMPLPPLPNKNKGDNK